MEEFLSRVAESELPFIVEGKKDTAALRALGCRTVITLRGPLFSFIERIAARHREVVILTDLDREGRKLYSMLRRGLTERGVKVDSYFREYLFRETGLRQIEGLATYVSTHSENASEKGTKRIRSGARPGRNGKHLL